MYCKSKNYTDHIYLFFMCLFLDLFQHILIYVFLYAFIYSYINFLNIYLSHFTSSILYMCVHQLNITETGAKQRTDHFLHCCCFITETKRRDDFDRFHCRSKQHQRGVSSAPNLLCSVIMSFIHQPSVIIHQLCSCGDDKLTQCFRRRKQARQREESHCWYFRLWEVHCELFIHHAPTCFRWILILPTFAQTELTVSLWDRC